MSKSARLRLAEHRAIWELVHECRDLGDDVGVWRKHLCAGVDRLNGGDGLVNSGELRVRGGQIQMIGSIEWGWESGFNRAAFDRALQTYGGRMEISPMMTVYFRRPAGADGACFRRRDLVPDRLWYPTRYYELVHETVGNDHTVLSFIAIPGRPEVCHGIAVSRRSSARRDFTDRERSLVEEVQRLTGPLVGRSLAGFDEPSPAALPPRVRDVLRCVLDGDSDKQVAARQRLSPHTVNEYVKAIYRHFGVNSRAELLARWVRRGWGRGRW